MWPIAISAVVAYLLGSIPFGYLIYRALHGKDIRELGSGNIGATNVLRSAGTGAGILTLLLDTGKGHAAVAIAANLPGHSTLGISLAALLVVVGHIFPVFLRFRGGKGVATGLGAFAGISPPAALISLIVFLGTLVIGRYVSVASMAATGAFPFILAIRGSGSIESTAAAFCAAGLILLRHRSNIQRLRAGFEPRLAAAKKETVHRM
jgi:glycerol-3-phosphate acyltransferase PlsY